MDLMHALILSVIEGVTEFLPISSTGHMILASHILGIPQTEFSKSFEIIIQLGAIGAIVFLYFKNLLQDKKAWPKIMTAFVPTAVIGLILYKFIKHFLIGNEWVTVLALFFGGIVLIVIEKNHTEKQEHLEKISNISYKTAFMIGVIQAISVIPGVSRAGTTIVGGLLLGLKRKNAVEFSFLLAIPTMLAATGLDLVKSSHSFTTDEFFLLGIGLIGSFITALFAVRYFLNFIKNNSFVSFGIYRILLAIIYAAVFLR